MKILQINKLYYPWIGGIEKVVQDIAEGINGRSGFQVDVLACQAKGRRRIGDVNGVKIYRAGSWGRVLGMPISLDFFFLFLKICKEYDFILIHHPFPLPFLIMPFIKNKNFFVWYHSDIVRQKKSKLFFLPFIKLGLHRSKKIIAANKNITKGSNLLKSFENKLEIIPFGLNTTKMKADADSGRQALKLKEKYGPSLILGVGRLVYYKGWEFLIEAMAKKEMKLLPKAKLLIIGQGPLEEKLKKLIKYFNLEDKVFIIEPVPDLRPFYEACELFVLPSVAISEAFGLVQLEAMSFGKPVINTDLETGVKEISLNEISGLTVRPQNADALAKAIYRILSNPELKARFGRQAKERIEESFDNKTFIDKVIKVFENKN